VDLDIWIDPICAWSWLTSRWLVEVSEHRDLRVRWRPMSLLLKHRLPTESPHFARTSHALSLLRVLERVRTTEGDEAAGSLYTEYGRHLHDQQNSTMDPHVALQRAGLDTSYSMASGDVGLDTAIRAHMAEGQALAGADASLPLIAFTTRNGVRVGFSGPTLTRRLPLPAALDLFDGFVLMAGVNGFWEIRRACTEPADLRTLLEQEIYGTVSGR
jgi:hypothetical protein